MEIFGEILILKSSSKQKKQVKSGKRNIMNNDRVYRMHRGDYSK